MRLLDQTRDDFRARRAGKNGMAGLELADLELNLIGFGFTDVGRVGNDEVESVGGEAAEQVALVELNAIFELMTGGVGARDLERGRRDIGGLDFGFG